MTVLILQIYFAIGFGVWLGSEHFTTGDEKRTYKILNFLFVILGWSCFVIMIDQLEKKS